MPAKRPAEPKIAKYNEVLALLTAKARDGDVRAQIALASHLRSQQTAETKPGDDIDEIANRRAARTG